MKKSLYFILLVTLIFSCQSVANYNAELDKKIEVNALKQDIDETYSNLKKYHPHLYWYITEEQLNYKFDSLKLSINQPLTPNEFYFKLAPIIAQVKEGHLRLRSLPKKYTKKEEKELLDKTPLFGQLDYKLINDKLYITGNKNNIKDIKIGAEVISINNEKVSDLAAKYKKLINSDGENQTFQKYNFNDMFFNFYTLQNGFLNDATLEISDGNTLKNIQLTRKQKTKEEIKVKSQQEKLATDKRLNDYNVASNTYNRSMKFLVTDSSVAYIKIKTFSATAAPKFYKQSFDKIKNGKSKYLILDFRNNLGGSLSEINTLYSYLAREKFTLIKTPETNFKNAALHRNYFYGQSKLGKVFSSFGYPFFLMANYAISNEGKDGKHYFKEFSSKPTKLKKNVYQGKIYVLINGSSFSAASMLAAKLKSDKRATLVGEETGGANDGTVAGFYNTLTLKNSKLKLPIGLLFIQPNIEFDNLKRGVIPNIDLPSTFNQISDNKDTELEWILKDIDKKSD